MIAPAGAHGAGLAGTAWPMFQHDPQHTGRSQYTGPRQLALKWRFPVNGIPGSPAIGRSGVIYLPVGQPNTDLGGFLYAINPDGTLRWRYRFPRPAGDSANTTQVPGFTTPAIDADGTIYVHTNAGASRRGISITSGPSYLFAINPNGTGKWLYPFNDGFAVFTGSHLSSPAIGADGTIYVGSKDTGLYALNPDGTENWIVVPDNSSISSSPAIGPNGTIYVNNCDFVAYGPNGFERWRAHLSQGCPVSGSPSVDPRGRIYACGSESSRCFAVGPRGQRLWGLRFGDFHWTPSISSDGAILFNSSDWAPAGGTFAMRPNGTRRWRYTPTYGTEGSAVLGSDDWIYVRDGQGPLTVLSPNGKLSDTRPAGFYSQGVEELSPAIGSNHTLYWPDPTGKRLEAYVQQR